MQAELETLKRVGATFNEAGFEGLEPYLHPDFEFHEPPEQPGASVFRGRAAAMEGFRAWARTWVRQESTTEGVAVLGDGRFAVLTRERMTGRDDLVIEQRALQLITLRDGVVTCWKSYWDRDRALSDLGVEPEDVRPLT